ncbi:MAG: hypothetical protein COX51_06575, partial [Syntrophobacteraceae bacterium CG23_combo_of_CG06-09_8_20_14_all_50_8]
AMDEEKKGFVVKDKRIFGEGGQTRSEDAPAPEKKEEAVKDSHRHEPEEKSDEQQYSFEVNFSNFLISLSTSALFHFGDFPDPATQKAEKNLPAAQQIIDTLSMLKNKTQGNLDENEKNLLDGVLYELRMRYIKEKTA